MGRTDDLANAKATLYLAEAIKRQAVGDGTWTELIRYAEAIAGSVDNSRLALAGFDVDADLRERQRAESAESKEGTNGGAVND